MGIFDSWFRERPIDIRHQVVGQHIAVEQLLQLMGWHIKNVSPGKPLSMIFFGSLGTGKTYFTKLAAQKFYKKGLNDPSVKYFIGPRDFPNNSDIFHYQDRLKRTIEMAAKRHKRTIFIFDEVDKMPNGLFSTLAPYLDNYEGTRRCIFLFISNAQANCIDQIVIRQYADNRRREDLKLYDFRDQLEKCALQQSGGFAGTNIIQRKLIDHYCPFLPLERPHIVDCIALKCQQMPMLSNQLSDNAVREAIADMWHYYPESSPLFSTEGARNIENKLFYAMEYINNDMPIPKQRQVRQTN